MNTENPNSLKYFDERYGTTMNRKCPSCKTLTWQQESTHTQYNGKRYLHNTSERIMGVVFENHLRGEKEHKDAPSGVYCETCFRRDVEK